MQNLQENNSPFRKCTCCESFMVTGYTDEELGTYYCSDKCLDKSVSKKEQHEAFEDESLYYTDWLDDTKVYVIFDNQYISLEDAEFIQKEFGNPSNKIKMLDYEFSRPIFTIVNNEQVELEI